MYPSRTAVSQMIAVFGPLCPVSAMPRTRRSPYLDESSCRLKGQVVPDLSLALWVNTWPVYWGRRSCYQTSVGESATRLAKELRDGQILLLENIRFHSGETKNSDTLSRELAELCECYVNDAFGTAHRAHASTAGVAKLVDNRAAGYCVAKEVESLNRILQSRRMGFVAVLGGAKVSDKIGVIESLLSRVERLLIGGAMAYTFLAARGIDVGESRIETEHIPTAKRILQLAQQRGIHLGLPIDHRCAEAFDAQADVVQIDDSAIPNGLMGLDIGPKTAEAYASCLP